METSAPFYSVLGISDLCVSIIDFLRDSRNDLKSCALASPAFTFPAQSHLFRVIKLDNGVPRRAAAAARLAEIMDGTPHLRRLVRTLHAPIDAAVLTHVVNMRLTRLNRLRLIGSEPRASDLNAARDLLSLPSVDWLTLNASFSSRAAFNLFFSRCTTSLRAMDLMYLIAPNDVLDPHPPDLPAHSGPRVQIVNLALARISPQVAEWFLDPRSPFDLSGLRRVEIYFSNSSTLAFLAPARTTIKELRLNASACGRKILPILNRH
jgi:hypothetical protein